MSQLGPLLLALAFACGPRSVSEESDDPTVVIPAPVSAAVASAQQELPELAPLPKRPRRFARASLPAPTGLLVARDGPPIVSVGPVDWDGPWIAPAPDAAFLAAHLDRLDTQEATLAGLTRTRYELSRSLDAIADVLPVLDASTRLRAGLQVCFIRRELEELERMQRALQVDVLAFREMIAPAVRLAENR